MSKNSPKQVNNQIKGTKKPDQNDSENNTKQADDDLTKSQEPSTVKPVTLEVAKPYPVRKPKSRQANKKNSLLSRNRNNSKRLFI